MKRILVIPIMLIYLLAATGIMIHLHYCGQQLESWTVFSKNGCPDDKCGDESVKSDGCCKDEVITAAKVIYEQNIVSEYKIKSVTAEWLFVPRPLFYHQDATIALTQKITTANRPNAPPGIWQQIPLYKLHSSFTYYG